MKLLLVMMTLMACTGSAFGRDDSLEGRMDPEFYKARSEPVVNIALLYYGDYYKTEDLDRVQGMLEKRFQVATASLLRINTVVKAVLPFKHLIRDFPDYTQPNVTDPERLQRLWYYDNLGPNVLTEIYEGSKAHETVGPALKSIDAILIVTGAQFDALGFAVGRMGVTENPMEIAWGLPGGGRVEYVTDARVVDELIHELGHALFLGHTSTQCQKPGLSLPEQRKCCAESPSRDDVMSYCRSRERVNEDFQFGFSACNLRNIKKRIVPAMLSGGEWKVANRESCK